MPNRCRSCKAEIVWAISATTGRPIPIDVEPHPDGNVRLERNAGAAPRATVLRADDERGGELYRPHWATCPDAESWRRDRPTMTKEDA